MITYVWDSSYEGSPSDLVPRDEIQWEIQKAKIGVEDRMNVQHVWDSVGQGIHRRGHVSVWKDGDDAAADVTNPIEGGLYLYDDGNSPHLYKVMMYHSGAWIELSTIDHGALTGLTDDDHQHYLKNGTVGNDVITGDLEMGGQLLGPTTPSGTNRKWGTLLQYGHRKYGHSSLGNASAVKNGIILGGNLRVYSGEFSGTIGIWEQGAFYFPDRIFLPQILVQTSGGNYRVVEVTSNPNVSGYYGWGIANNELTAYPYRIRFRYLGW